MVKPTASKRRRHESERLPDDSELEAETTGAKTMRRFEEHPELNKGEGAHPPAKRRGKSKGGVETFGIYEAQKGKIISIAIAISIELAGPAFFQAHTDPQRQMAVEAAIDLNSFAFPGGIRGFRKEKRENPLQCLNFMNKIKGSCSSHNSVSNIDVKFELLRVLLLAFPFMLILGFSFPDTPETSERIGESAIQTSLIHCPTKEQAANDPTLKKLRFILMQAFQEGESLLGDDHPVRRILGESGTLIQVDSPGDAKSGKGKDLPDSIVESTGASACASAGAGVKASLSFRNCFFEFLSPGHEHYTLAQQFHSFMGKQANIFVSLADESWVYS